MSVEVRSLMQGLAWEMAEGRHVRIPGAGELAAIDTTVYSDAALTTPLSPSLFYTDDEGELPGYVADGQWALTLGTVTYQVNAVSGGFAAVIKEAPLNIQYPEFSSLVVGDDWTPALQALADVGDAVQGYLPAGEYAFDTALVRAVPNSLKLKGDGMGATLLHTTADTHLFDLTLTAGANVTIEDMTLLSYYGSAPSVGSAVKCDGNYVFPGLTMRNVDITRSGLGNEFRRGLDLVDMAEPDLSNVTILGMGPTGVCEAVSIRSLSAATGGSYKLSGISAYGTKYGLRIVTTQNPGVEGVQVDACDWVNVETAIAFINSASGYAPPMLTVIGGHSSATLRNFDIEKMNQLTVLGHLAYSSGAGHAEFMRLIDTGVITISDNHFMWDGTAGSDPAGIVTSGVVLGTGILKIIGNTFALEPGGSAWPIQTAAAQYFRHAQIIGNVAPNSTKFADIGLMHESVEIAHNYPRDAKDGIETIAVLGSGPYTLNVSACRADLIDVTAGTPRTITAITPRRIGDTVTLKSVNHTLQHGTAGIFAGAVDYVFPAGGGRVTLRWSGVYWYEIGRA